MKKKEKICDWKPKIAIRPSFALQSNGQTDTHTWTWQIYDQPSPECRGDEKKCRNIQGHRQELQWPLVNVSDFVNDVWNVKVFNLEQKSHVFLKWFLMSPFIVKLFYKNDIYNLIYIIIIVEKTFKSMQCQQLVFGL